MTDKHWNRNAGRVSSELFRGQKSSSWWNLFSVRQDSMNQRSHLIQLPHSELNPSVHGNLVPQFFTSRSTAGPQSILITGSTAVSRPVVILIQATCCSIPGVTQGLSKYWGSRSTGALEVLGLSKYWQLFAQICKDRRTRIIGVATDDPLGG